MFSINYIICMQKCTSARNGIHSMHRDAKSHQHRSSKRVLAALHGYSVPTNENEFHTISNDIEGRVQKPSSIDAHF